MHPNLKEASDHIREYLSHGVPEMHIREHFLKHGWSPEWFDEAFHHAKAQNAAIQQEPHHIAAPVEIRQAPVLSADMPRKYRVFRAIKDYFDAVRSRPKEYFGAAGVGIAAYVLGLVPVGLAVALIALLKPHGVVLAVLVLLGILLFLVWYAVATTFFMVITSWVLAPDHTDSPRSIAENIRDAAARTPRAAVSVAAASLITFLPLFVTLFVLLMSVLAAFSGHGSAAGVAAFAGFMMVLSLVWLLIASLRLALVQQVAIFEPELKIRQTFRRSSYLLKSGGFVNNGQWFLLKGCLLLLAINIVLSLFTHASLDELQRSDNIFLNLVIVVVTIVAQGVLAMLYFNRAAVLGKTTS